MSIVSTIDVLNLEVQVLKAKVEGLATDFHSWKESSREDFREIKEDQKALLQFMYATRGGRAWLFSLLTAAAACGGLLSALFHFLIPPKF